MSELRNATPTETTNRRYSMSGSASSKKDKQRDDDETTQVTGPYPEDVFSCDARRLYKMVRRLIPMKAETIKVADRKMIRETADEIMERLIQITEIVKELRHNLKLKDQKIEEVQKAKNVSTPIFSYAERVKAGGNSVSFTPKPQISESSHTVRVQAKESDKNANFVKKVIMRTVDSIKSNILVKNVRATKSGDVVVDCANKEDAEKIKLTLNMKAKNDVAVRDVKKTLATCQN
ncbi:uncharacterized protein LOC108740805 [Agrilus planipennis]|uniref:Uncharacterized protein LOC108740805 n=1 Tax=Agrilus planipennis TaxID=224129 RepID=A0A1W4XEM1_AGRPL|nr:uncharacterized protein LOC108740805 [Agrilus planipennis]